MTDTSANIRDEMAETRAEMSLTTAELRARASESVQAAKQKLNVAQLIREHPWPALGVAVALGAAIGGSRADEKAAAATVAGARRAVRAPVDAVKGSIEKRRARGGDEPRAMSDLETASESRHVSRGVGARLSGMLAATIAGALDGVLNDMRVASHAWGARIASASRPAGTAPAAGAVVAQSDVESVRADLANAAVPLPNEMYPSELDARADAVEALGGGTHEPPLAPGAGDLGARWA